MSAATPISFRCNACGRCCDTPPAMTVPELFHHERLFVGCLAVRRPPVLRTGDRLAAGDIGQAHAVDAADAAEAGGLADRLLVALPTATGRPAARFALATQGFDYPSAGACPARADDGRCTVHHDRKPAMCGTVPLDPYVADRLQHVVLMNRTTGKAYVGADCIAPGLREGFGVLAEGGAVVDAVYGAHLARHRDALAVERARWGDAVADWLRPGLLAGSTQVPADGHLTLPLVPVLAVLAARSGRCRDRCVRYAEAQIALIDRKVAAALARRLDRDKPVTRELRGWRQAYERFVDAMQRVADIPASDDADAGTEAYLGLDPMPAMPVVMAA